MGAHLAHVHHDGSQARPEEVGDGGVVLRRRHAVQGHAAGSDSVLRGLAIAPEEASAREAQETPCSGEPETRGDRVHEGEELHRLSRKSSASQRAAFPAIPLMRWLFRRDENRTSAALGREGGPGVSPPRRGIPAARRTRRESQRASVRSLPSVLPVPPWLGSRLSSRPVLQASPEGPRLALSSAGALHGTGRGSCGLRRRGESAVGQQAGEAS